MYIKEDATGHQARDIAQKLTIDLLIDFWSFLSALDFLLCREGIGCVQKGERT